MRAAVLAVVALPALAPVAVAQTTQTVKAVDEKTGPVSFANVASVRLGSDPQHGGSLITETQRSPLTPGQSKLSTDRVAVPKNDGERSTFGGNWEIDLGKFADATKSPYPAGIASRDHNVVAALQATTVPTAVAETNYALRDTTRGKSRPVDDTMLVLENARSAVDCSAPNKATGTTTLTRLWVRGEDDNLKQVAMPAGSASLSVKNLRMGAPGDVPQANPTNTLSDLVVSRVSSFDQLVKQDGWRGGDVTAQAGWRVDVTTHVHDASNVALQDVHTSLVLGGVSCSIPKNFVAVSGNSGNGADATQPPVPTEVPAGYLGTAAAAPAQGDYRLPLGLGLLVAGLVFGGLSIGLGRRRAARSRGE
ncbi:hypothetical protein VSH64_22440 [Amycolatopsis rhabdoformis]|uniref:Uncharacterized protein n=1 Tax=Amycolatopsis rhabdoformis TaxID=1448059 RepID=A0ABZ1IM57_9PSEU|nr:hypothetical protein [Amycolatopsis rhabdoformis]WSE34802.1 hypothetical protein VSH64_22440 [Amycolatopsis rhabdoformis]